MNQFNTNNTLQRRRNTSRDSCYLIDFVGQKWTLEVKLFGLQLKLTRIQSITAMSLKLIQ